MTGFTVIELTREIPYIDWAIEFVANPVFCGGATVLVTAALAPSRPFLAALWALAVVTAAVAIPASATFLFGDAGLTPVIATIAGGLAAVLVACTDRSHVQDE